MSLPLFSLTISLIFITINFLSHLYLFFFFSLASPLSFSFFSFLLILIFITTYFSNNCLKKKKLRKWISNFSNTKLHKIIAITQKLYPDNTLPTTTCNCTIKNKPIDSDPSNYSIIFQKERNLLIFFYRFFVIGASAKASIHGPSHHYFYHCWQRTARG